MEWPPANHINDWWKLASALKLNRGAYRVAAGQSKQTPAKMILNCIVHYLIVVS